MRENGVLERLYRQEPEKYLQWGEMDLFNTRGMFTPPFNWGTYSDTKGSEESRAKNTQTLWMRSTIPWKLDCDRDIMHREYALAVFELDLDHLGFIDYITYLSIFIVVLLLLPFLVYCCDCTGSKGYIFSTLEPFITRIIFTGLFFGMLKFV